MKRTRGFGRTYIYYKNDKAGEALLMKEGEIDRKLIVIYDDGSVGIPYNGTQIHLDFLDIEYM